MARRSTLPVLAAAAILWTAGCGSSGTTPAVTAATAEVTAAVSPAPVATPQPTAGQAQPTPTATPPAPTPAPSPAATAAPSTSPTPSAPPGSVSQCTGTAKQQQFLSDAASHLPFSVYCAHLPSGWWLQVGEWFGGSSPWIYLKYESSAGGFLGLSQGDWCRSSPSECWPVGVPLGPAMLGNLDGQLVSVNATQFGIYVDPETKRSYAAIGKGFTRDAFVSLVAELIRLPRP